MGTNGRLAERTALVTGSTRGLGESIAKGLAREGARVAVTGRSAAPGERVVSDIRAAGGVAEFVRLDLSDERSVDAAVAATVGRFGGLDILVNNAAATEHITGASTDGGVTSGVKRDGALEHLTTEAIQSILVPGILGLMWMVRAAMPELRKSGRGAIVNISSVASIQGVSDLDVYTATKGAMNALTRSTAVNGAPEVRCNTVIAGTFETDGLAPALAVPALREAFLETVLTPTLGDPANIADPVIFLASDEARFITGECLRVDGGMSIRMAVPKLDPAMAAMGATAEA
jgi:NAD(P)-dependent dehydrogenase (short-subunit alcohol dehydrogenase family)